MIVLLTYLSTLITITSWYLYRNYKKSKNKTLFLETGSHKAILWTLGILCIAPFLVELIIPDNLNIYDHAYKELDKAAIVELIKHSHYLDYLGLRLSNIIYNSSYFAVFPLLLVVSTWFIYLRKINFRTNEKIDSSLLVLGLGALMFFPFLLWRDYSELILGLVNKDDFFYDFGVVTLSGSAFPQELLKIIPLILMLKFAKSIDEPYDYIRYASLSALGFSCMDNAVDFAGQEGMTILGKSLLSTVGHMAYSSILVYGFVLSKFNYKERKIFVLFQHVILAVLLHAGFEFLTMYSTGHWGYWISTPFFIAVLQYWAIIINNSINNSSFIKKSKIYHLTEVKVFLAIALSLILVMDYVFKYIQFGIVEAHWQYINSSLWGAIFILYYITNFNNFDFFSNYWRPLNWTTQDSDDEPEIEYPLDWLVDILRANHMFAANITKYKLNIYPPNYNQLVNGILYQQDIMIVSRMQIYPEEDVKISDPYWFVAKLSEPLNILDHDVDFILIKLENSSVSSIHTGEVRGHLRFIPDLELLKQKKLLKEDFTYGGYVMLNTVEIPEYVSI